MTDRSLETPPRHALSRYDEACRSLEAAVRVDEVKEIHDQAVAMQEYARQAKDGKLLGWATEIKLRAERRAGEMLAAMHAKGERATPAHTLSRGDSLLPREKQTLDELGVTKTQSSRWQKLAALDEDEFEARAAAATQQAMWTLDATREERQAAKKAHREAREAELGARQTALPDRRYGVIVADPPWRFEVYSRESGMDRAADNHYPTTSLEEVEALDVPSIAADDCVLFLWATAPMIEHALAVMRAWGFSYKSQVVWIKDRVGHGYWFRNKHELLLVGTRGHVPAPAMGEQFNSAIEAMVGEHSAKPEVFLELVEAYFPSLPRIELNRRGAARPGWAAWGNEFEGAEAAQ